MKIQKIYEDGHNLNQDYKVAFLEIEIEFHMLNIKNNNKYSNISIDKSKNHIYKCLEKYYEIKKSNISYKIENKKYFDGLIENIKKPVSKGKKINMDMLNNILSVGNRKITILDQLYFKG